MSVAAPAFSTTVVEHLSASNPWPGLLPFGEADHAFFKGRDREVEALHRLVKRERLTVLFGKSGLGKSSLLQAGLFPRLRDENLLPVYIRLDFSESGSSLCSQVKEAIARAGAREATAVPEARKSESLWEYFHRHGAYFANRRRRVVLPLLVFDQFEEIFTLGRSDAARAEDTAAFLDELEDLIQGAPPAAVNLKLDEHPEEAERFEFDRHHYRILLSLREDFLPELETMRQRVPSIGRNRFRLRHLNGHAALRVVAQIPELIERDVAEAVVRFVAAAREADRPLAELAVEPALLSVICRELNIKRERLGETKITVGVLEGSHEQILSDFYERSVTDLSLAVRTFVEEELLTVSGYRDSVAMENALSAPGVTLDAIADLVARRLVRVEELRGVQRIELTHDLLAGVVTASRDARRRQEEKKKEQQARREAEARERGAIRELKRSHRRAAMYLALFVLTAGALFWALLNRQEALRARDEAAEQRLAADSRAREARVVQEQAERAKAEAETARVQAEEAMRIADTALSQELRARGIASEKDQESERLRLRADAEVRLRKEEEERARRAKEEALEKQQLADAQRRRAEDEARRRDEAVKRGASALESQLVSSDASQAIEALRQLVVDHGRDSRELVGLFLEPQDLARFATFLYWAQLDHGSALWLQAAREEVPARLADFWGVPPPPDRRQDEELNVRVRIAGGRFQMGSLDADNEQPVHWVRLSPFHIQEHEVTNAEFRRFNSKHEFKQGQERFPVTGVTWGIAMGYALWLGGSLPTEAQWEFAARGVTGRTYPWGDSRPSCKQANYGSRCGGLGPVMHHKGEKRSPTTEGVYDLVGSVWEWCDDWYGDYPEKELKDPRGPTNGPGRVIRGGSHSKYLPGLLGEYRFETDYRAAFRYHLERDQADPEVGFRVVWLEAR